MARDVYDFVSEALKEGHSIDDIVGFMSKHENPGYKTWATEWQATAANYGKPVPEQDMQSEFEAEKARLKNRFNEQKEDLTTTNVGGFSLPSVLTGPGSLVAGSTLLGIGVGYGLSKLKSRSIKNPQVAEIAGDVAKAEATPVDYSIPAYQRKAEILDTAGVAAPEPKPLSGMDLLNERKRQIMDAAQQNAPVAPGPIQRQPIPPFAGAPSFMSSAPKAPVVPATPPTVSEAIASGENPSTSIQRDVAQMIDETPATKASEQPETKTTPKRGRPAGSVNKTPEQRILEKGGLPGMTEAEAGMRGHLLGMYGGKNNPAAQQAYEQVRQILGYTPAYAPGSQGGSLAPEETGKILDWRKENIPGPKVNLTRDMKSVLKKGGPAAVAALVLTPEFARASETEKRQIIGEALMPVGLTPSEAGAPGVAPETFSQAALLGSPYAQTEWAKTQRLRDKAGAGRGIAPPSQYQR